MHCDSPCLVSKNNMLYKISQIICLVTDRLYDQIMMEKFGAHVCSHKYILFFSSDVVQPRCLLKMNVCQKSTQTFVCIELIMQPHDLSAK